MGADSGPLRGSVPQPPAIGVPARRTVRAGTQGWLDPGRRISRPPVYIPSDPAISVPLQVSGPIPKLRCKVREPAAGQGDPEPGPALLVGAPALSPVGDAIPTPVA